MGEFSHQAKRLFSFSSVMMVCGTVLIMNGRDTVGMILASLGVIGAVIDYSLLVQKDTKDREDKEQLYENIKQAVGTIPFIGNQKDSKDSTFH